MASVQDLRRRIRSVRNTRKITKAFELVASARLRRAQARIEAMRPYADRMLERTIAIVPLTGDRGLAGPFNSQILRHAFALDRTLRGDGKEVRWLVAGRKGASTLRFRGYQLDQAWTGFSDRPSYHDAQAISHRLADLYVAGEIDRAVVVYNHFVSPLVQTVVEQDVLPIPEETLRGGDEAQERAALGDFIYEPEPEEILARLLPFYLETELYRALLESAASEQGARMTAMRNASKNAAELIDSLTLAMNRARQAEITQEILEVVAGADALTA